MTQDQLERRNAAIRRAWEDPLRRALMRRLKDRPKDFPDGYIARMHEVGGDRAGPSPIALTLELHELREVFRDAGLHCVARHEKDDPKIVETWV